MAYLPAPTAGPAHWNVPRACSTKHFNNDFILPSEKVQYLKKFAANKEHDPAIIKRMQEGLYVCTSCDRCTNVCPSGINLKELFISSRYSLLTTGTPETTMLSHFSFPLALAQNFVDDHLKALKKVTELFKKSFQHLTDLAGPAHSRENVRKLPTILTRAVIHANAAVISAR